MTDKKKIGIYDKLSRVSAACAYLQKDGTNSAQNYTYISEAHVKRAVTRAVIDAGLSYGGTEMKVIQSKEVETARGAKWIRYVVEAQITITDPEGSGAVTFTGLGSGMDSGDKAVAKAATQAIKTALTHGLGISSGDDPEADEATDVQFGDGYTAPTPEARRPEPRQERSPAPPRRPQERAPAPPRRDPGPLPQTSGRRVSEGARQWRAPFGRSKGMSLAEMTGKDAQWFRNVYVQKLEEDPGSRYADEWRDGIEYIDEVFGALEDAAREAINHSAPRRGDPDPEVRRDERKPEEDDDFPF